MQGTHSSWLVSGLLLPIQPAHPSSIGPLSHSIERRAHLQFQSSSLYKGDKSDENM